MPIHTAIAPAAQATQTNTLFHRIWPPATIIVGLGLTAAWIALFGYGLVSQIKIALSCRRNAARVKKSSKEFYR